MMEANPSANVKFVYLTYSHKYTHMADLLHMIFIILGRICHTRIFWTIRWIDVSCICHCIFIICGNKSGACICLLSILPFMDVQNVGYTRIIYAVTAYTADNDQWFWLGNNIGKRDTQFFGMFWLKTLEN